MLPQHFLSLPEIVHTFLIIVIGIIYYTDILIEPGCISLVFCRFTQPQPFQIRLHGFRISPGLIMQIACTKERIRCKLSLGICHSVIGTIAYDHIYHKRFIRIALLLFFRCSDDIFRSERRNFLYKFRIASVTLRSKRPRRQRQKKERHNQISKDN